MIPREGNGGRGELALGSAIRALVSAISWRAVAAVSFVVAILAGVLFGLAGADPSAALAGYMAGREAVQAESTKAIWAEDNNPGKEGRSSAQVTALILGCEVLEPGWGLKTAKRRNGHLVLHVTVGPDTADHGAHATAGLEIVGGAGIKAGKEFRIEDDAVWTRSER